jgi:hypothetical protein
MVAELSEVVSFEASSSLREESPPSNSEPEEELSESES